MEDFPVPLLSGGVRPVQRYFTRFSPWFGPEVERTWNKSPLVEYAGRGPFAELALLGLLEEEGWEGVWVYRANKFTKAWHPPVHGPISQQIPEEQRNLYKRISAKCQALCERFYVRGGSGGCWDVFAWRSTEVLFAEAKRQRKDFLQGSQCGWLEAALEEGVPLSSFLIVEWDLENAATTRA
jgi:hypothetical protein